MCIGASGRGPSTGVSILIVLARATLLEPGHDLQPVKALDSSLSVKHDMIISHSTVSSSRIPRELGHNRLKVLHFSLEVGLSDGRKPQWNDSRIC